MPTPRAPPSINARVSETWPLPLTRTLVPSLSQPKLTDAWIPKPNAGDVHVGEHGGGGGVDRAAHVDAEAGGAHDLDPVAGRRSTVDKDPLSGVGATDRLIADHQIAQRRAGSARALDADAAVVLEQRALDGDPSARPREEAAAAGEHVRVSDRRVSAAERPDRALDHTERDQVRGVTDGFGVDVEGVLPERVAIDGVGHRGRRRVPGRDRVAAVSLEQRARQIERARVAGEDHRSRASRTRCRRAADVPRTTTSSSLATV